DFVHEEDRMHIHDPYLQLLQGERESACLEARFLKHDSEPIWMEIEMAPGLDDSGRVIGTVGTLNDISLRKSNEERLLYMATHDSLTGLPNRNLFEDRLSHAIAQSMRMQRMVAVILLDLDQFKIVNDSMGHDQGDILLGIVASKLLQSVRTGDTVAR